MPFVSALPQELIVIADRARHARPRRRRRCSTAPVRACPRCASRSSRSWPSRASAASVDDVVVTHRLAAGARPGREAVPRPGRRRARRGAELRRRARRVPVVPGRGRARRHGRGRADPRRRCARPSPRLRGRGRRIKFLYTIPNFHNPAGVTLSAGSVASRSSRSAGRTSILVLEDNPYGLLYFDEPAPARDALGRRGRRHLPRHVLEDPRPGFRVGLGARAARHPREARPRRTSRRSSRRARSARSSSPSTWRPPTGRARSTPSAASTASARTRCSPRSGSTCPSCSWTIPNGGFYVWLTMPDEPRLEGDAAARRQGARRLHAREPRSSPTATAATRCGCRSAIRRPSAIREGIRRLATVVNGELDLLDTFAGTGPLHAAAERRLRSRTAPDLS